MTYEAWNAKLVEARIIEAAETLMLCPNVSIGGAGASMWRECKSEYGPEPTAVKKRPSAGALDRMPATWEWINALPEQSDRKLIYAWSYVKVKKGLKISAFAEENAYNDRTLKRHITSICQYIANDLNRKLSVRLTVAVDEVSENRAEVVPYNISSHKCAVTNWRTRDAKPTDRNHPDREELVKRLEKQNARRRTQKVA